MAKVLLIENDSTSRDRLSFGLEKEGFDMVEAECIISGLENTRLAPPDVVLCSNQLPGLGAVDLLDLVREDSALAGIPVVIFSEDHTDKLLSLIHI